MQNDPTISPSFLFKHIWLDADHEKRVQSYTIYYILNINM